MLNMGEPIRKNNQLHGIGYIVIYCTLLLLDRLIYLSRFYTLSIIHNGAFQVMSQVIQI